MTTILIADIGGTHARFATADAGGLHNPQILSVADYPGVREAAQTYLAGKPLPDRAVFALAGPVGGDWFDLTNFPWSFSVRETAAALGIPLALINDFHASALGVLNAGPDVTTQIGEGEKAPHGNIGVIGPGTGLGVAGLIYDPNSKKYVVMAGEGGHVTLPVVTPREVAIRDWLLQNKYSHVSAERVCSGKGLLNLYAAICALDNKPVEDLTPEDITGRAIARTCAVCTECLDLMMAFLGRIAGNLALTTGATGGVYLTGGILPRLGMDYLEKSRLRAEFVAKGRQSGYTAGMPLILVDDPILALKGLRQYGMDALR